MHKLNMFVFGIMLLGFKALSDIASTPQQEARFALGISTVTVMTSLYLFLIVVFTLILKLLNILRKRSPLEQDANIVAITSFFLTFCFFTYIDIPEDAIIFLAHILKN